MLLILMMILLGANALYFKSEKTYKLSWILLILYAGLRYHYGNDYISYLVHYDEITSVKRVFTSIYEFGYCGALYVFKLIGMPFRVFIFSIAAVSIGVKVAAIERLSKDKYISLLGYFLLFYVFNDTEQMRHGLALGLCLYALTYIMVEEVNYVKFYALTALAFTFHYSTIVFLLAPLVIKVFENKKLIIVATVLAAIVAVLDVTNILAFINNTFIGSEYISIKLALYQGQELPLITTSLLIRLYSLSLFYQVYRKNMGDIVIRKSLYLYYTSLLLFIGFGSLEIIASRGSIFYRYVEIILIGSIFTKDQDKLIKYQAYVLAAYYIFKFITTIINPIYWNYSIM